MIRSRHPPKTKQKQSQQQDHFSSQLPQERKALPAEMLSRMHPFLELIWGGTVVWQINKLTDKGQKPKSKGGNTQRVRQLRGSRGRKSTGRWWRARSSVGSLGRITQSSLRSRCLLAWGYLIVHAAMPLPMFQYMCANVCACMHVHTRHLCVGPTPTSERFTSLGGCLALRCWTAQYSPFVTNWNAAVGTSIELFGRHNSSILGLLWNSLYESILYIWASFQTEKKFFLKKINGGPER